MFKRTRRSFVIVVFELFVREEYVYGLGGIVVVVFIGIVVVRLSVVINVGIDGIVCIFCCSG